MYAADKLGRVRILDFRTGSAIDSLPTSAMPIMVSNGQTDRIYLAAEGGTIQCLRELEQTSPMAYNESRKPPPDDDWAKPPPPKVKTRPADDGAPKVAQDRPAAKKAAAKKAVKKDDAADFGGDDQPAETPAKTAKKAAGKAAGKAAAKKDAAGGDDLFGK